MIMFLMILTLLAAIVVLLIFSGVMIANNYELENKVKRLQRELKEKDNPKKEPIDITA